MTTSSSATDIAHTGPTDSGLDLARVALRTVQLAARERGDIPGQRRPKPAPTRRRQGRDGRDPAGFAGVLKQMMTDRGWELPVEGGSLTDQWPTIAATLSTTLADHTTACAFNAATGELTIRPDSAAYATQLRLLTPRIIHAANTDHTDQLVRTIRVLPPGTTTPTNQRTPTTPNTPPSDTTHPSQELELPLPRTYQQAREAFNQARTHRTHHTDPSIAAAIERQTHAMRTLRAQAFLDSEDHATEQETPVAPRRTAHATRAAALRRARIERATNKPSQLPEPEADGS